MVFDDQRSDFTFFTELHNLVEGGAVKVCTREAVVYEQASIFETVFSSVLL